MRSINALEIKDKTKPWLISFSLTFGGIILLTLPPAIIRWNGKIGLPIIQEYLQGEIQEKCLDNSKVPQAAADLADEICLPTLTKKELRQISPSWARFLRISASITALVMLSIASYRWNRDVKEARYEIVDQVARDHIYETLIEAQVRDVTGSLVETVEQQQIKMLVPNVKTFDPRLLRDHVGFPHLRVLGGTRAGKTHTTGKVLNWLPGAKIIIAPKVNPKKSDWQQCLALIRAQNDQQTLNRKKELIGQGLRFETIAHALNHYSQIDGAYVLVGAEHDYQAIGEALKWALQEMATRQSQYIDWNPIEIIIDDATIVCQKVPHFGKILKELLLLAGDVDLRIWALVHMSSMKALKLEEGNAELIENFKTIYIGKFAHKELGRLINKATDGEEARYYQARKEVMKSLERAVLVVDQPLDTDILDVPPNLLKGEPETPQDIYESQGADPPYKWVNQPPPEADEKPVSTDRNLSVTPDPKVTDNPQPVTETNSPKPLPNNEVTESDRNTLGELITLMSAIYKLEEQAVSRALQRMIWESKINPDNSQFKGLKKEILWHTLNVKGEKYSKKGQKIWHDLIEIVNKTINQNSSN